MTQGEMTPIHSLLADEQYISLVTYRKNGNAVATPVWFAEDQGKLYVVTQADAWKVKRIRHNSHVKFAACNVRGVVHGEEINGMAQLHPLNTPTADHANRLLNKKYGLMKRFFEMMWKLRGTEVIFIEITPQVS
ncbi:MAG: PPOX class F420-dependent oxidoreductase [Anaerolineae bacterium]